MTPLSPLLQQHHPRRGFISGIVIGMFVLVGIALVSLTMFFTTQARRTQAAAQGAQLRQLLLAAPAYAQAELTSGGNQPRDVQIPVPVEDATLTLTIAKNPDAAPSASPPLPGTAQVTATATFRNHKAVQTLAFRQTPAAWLLVDTRLIQSP